VKRRREEAKRRGEERRRGEEKGMRRRGEEKRRGSEEEKRRGEGLYLYTALAKATRCFCPPLKFIPFSPISH
jgi:hypothetical protein